MGLVLVFSRPNHELGAVCKETARDIGWGICLCPRDDIKNPEAQLLQGVGHGKDVVVSATYPYGTILLQLFPAQGNPLQVERVYGIHGSAFVPFAFVHADDFTALNAEALIA